MARGVVAGQQRRLLADAVGKLKLVHELGVLVALEPIASIALALFLEEAIVSPGGHCFLLYVRAGRDRPPPFAAAGLPAVGQFRRAARASAGRTPRAARGAGECQRALQAADGLAAAMGKSPLRRLAT